MARQAMLEKSAQSRVGAAADNSLREKEFLGFDLEQVARSPDAFLASLDWSIETDFAMITDIQTADGPAGPFQSAAWLQAALGAAKDDQELSVHIVCARHNGAPLLIVPLCGHQGAFGLTLSFIGQRLSDYNDPIFDQHLAGRVDADFMEALWQRVGQLIPQADLISLHKLLHAPQLPKIGSVRLWSQEPEQGHWLKIKGSWEESQDGLFGKSSRRSLARKAKKLSEMGELDCVVLSDPQERLAAVERLARWKSVQLEGLGSANPFRGDEFSNFLKSAVSLGSPENFRLCQLSAGETPLALTLMLCDDHRWFLYQTAFTDREEGRFSPGLLLLRDILKRAHDAGVAVFDFGLGNEGYKRKYCDQEQFLYRQLIALSAKGRAAMVVEYLKFRLRTLASSNAVMRKWVLAMLRVADKTVPRNR